MKITVILAFYNLVLFLNQNPFKTDQSKRQIFMEKTSGFVDLGFVKTCDELVISPQRVEWSRRLRYVIFDEVHNLGTCSSHVSTNSDFSICN